MTPADRRAVRLAALALLVVGVVATVALGGSALYPMSALAGMLVLVLVNRRTPRSRSIRGVPTERSRYRRGSIQ